MDGRISLDEALRNADSPNNLRLRINLSDEQPGQSPLAALAPSLSLEGEEPPELPRRVAGLAAGGNPGLSLAIADD